MASRTEGHTTALPQPAFGRYAAAVLAVVLAGAVRTLLAPVLGDRSVFMLFALAVMVAAWYGGRGPGFLATGLGCVLGSVLFLAAGRPHPALHTAVIIVLIFIVTSSGISLLAGRLRREAQARRESEQRTIDILGSITDGFAALDPELRFTYVNPAGVGILGRTSAELIGAPAMALFGLEGPLLAEGLHACVAGRAAHLESFDAARSRWMELHVYPARDGGVAAYFRDVTGRKTAEEALRASEARYSSLAEAIPALVWAAEPGGRSVYANSQARDYLGPAGEQGWRASIHPDDEDQTLNSWRESLAGGTQFAAEQRLRRADGSYRWFLTRGVPVRNNRGGVTGWIGASIDIHERKRAEEELRTSEERFRRMVELSAEGIWTLDGEGRTTFANSRMAGMLGSTPEEMLGRFFAGYIEADHRERARAAFESRKQGYTGPEDYRMRRRDGRVVWVTVTASVLRDDRGGFLGVLAMVTDLSEHRRAEAERRQQEALMRLALEAGHMGAWDWDLRSGELTWSDLHCALFGLAPGPVKPDYTLWASIVHPGDRAPVEAAMQQARQERRPFATEYRVIWPDRSEHWIESRGQFFYDDDGRPVRLRGVVADVTERKSAEEALRDRQKQESVGVLAGGVAHDFNNLLVGILGAASYAQELLPDPHEAAPMLGLIAHSAERAAQLTRQLLAYSGQGRFTLEAVDLGAALREECAELRASLPAGLELREEHEPGLPPIEADAAQIRQLSTSLLVNACEAVGDRAGGSVTVRTRAAFFDARRLEAGFRAYQLAPGRFVVLEVADTGPGINQELLGRIFDPFFTTKFTGRGLGLAAAQGIVRGHRGGMEVETAPGRGTCFRVLLPVAAVRPFAIVRGTPAAEVPARSLVLVVDDEEIVRQTAKAALERVGLGIVLASGGEEALELLAAHRDQVALVLLDMSMPGMSGTDVLRAMRQSCPALPVLVCSGYSEQEVVRRFEGLPIDGVLEKPFTARALSEKVAHVLTSRSSTGSAA